MAPHLAAVEQDKALRAMARQATTSQILAMLQKMRDRRGVTTVNITVVRRFLKGKTHKRAVKETRGRKRVYSRRNVPPFRRQKTVGSRAQKWPPANDRFYYEFINFGAIGLQRPVTLQRPLPASRA